MADRTQPVAAIEDGIAAAQAWWREAGVDFAFGDEPRAWLVEPEDAAAPQPRQASAEAPPSPPQLPPIGGNRTTWPRDLAAFRQWWLDEPTLDGGGLSPRVAPAGEPGGALMVLVPMPEAEDRERLLASVQGRLIAGFIEATGLGTASVYLASALPRHTPLPNWAGLDAGGLGEVLAHHIALAAPRRLLVLGRSILPLLGHDPAQGSPVPSQIAIQGRELPMLASFGPDRLLQSAKLRAGLWRRWLDWTDDDSE